MSSLPDTPSALPGSNAPPAFPIFGIAAAPGNEAVPTLASQLVTLKAVDLDTLSVDMNTWPCVRVRGSRYVLED